MKADAKLEQQIAAIGDLSREELVALWEKQYGCLPPKGIKRGLLERSAAWHLQARRLGGLSSVARRVLKAAEKNYLVQQGGASGSEGPVGHPWSGHGRTGIASDGANQLVGAPVPLSNPSPHPAPADASRPAPIILPPGTRLLREWNGRMYAVDVLEKGFVMDGKTYRSLSAIAKRITGAEWSGPRFFRL